MDMMDGHEKRLTTSNIKCVLSLPEGWFDISSAVDEMTPSVHWRVSWSMWPKSQLRLIALGHIVYSLILLPCCVRAYGVMKTLIRNPVGFRLPSNMSCIEREEKGKVV